MACSFSFNVLNVILSIIDFFSLSSSYLYLFHSLINVLNLFLLSLPCFVSYYRSLSLCSLFLFIFFFITHLFFFLINIRYLPLSMGCSFLSLSFFFLFIFYPKSCVFLIHLLPIFYPSNNPFNLSFMTETAFFYPSFTHILAQQQPFLSIFHPSNSLFFVFFL